jgi:hypothetical protein
MRAKADVRPPLWIYDGVKRPLASNSHAWSKYTAGIIAKLKTTSSGQALRSSGGTASRGATVDAEVVDDIHHNYRSWP